MLDEYCRVIGRMSVLCVGYKMQKPQTTIKKISVDGKRKNRKKIITPQNDNNRDLTFLFRLLT